MPSSGFVLLGSYLRVFSDLLASYTTLLFHNTFIHFSLKVNGLWGGGRESRPNNLQCLPAPMAKVKCFGHIVCTLPCSCVYTALISDFYGFGIQVGTSKLTVSHFQAFSWSHSKVYPLVRSGVIAVLKCPGFINNLAMFG